MEFRLHQTRRWRSFFWLFFILFIAIPSYADPQTLTITNSHSWKPFSYADKGVPRGLLVDFWRLYSEVNNTPIEFALTDWNDSLLAMKEGGRIVHGGLVYSSQRDTYLDYVAAIFELSTSLYVLNDEEGRKTDRILPWMEIGVVKGGYEEEYIKKNFPLAVTVPFKNNAALIEAAMKKTVKRIIVDTQVATYYFSLQDNPHQFVPIDKVYTKNISVAVAEGSHELLHEIKAGIANIPASELQRIEQKWLNTSTRDTLPSWLAPVLSAFFIGMLISYVYILKLTVRRKTRALQLANLKLEEFAYTDSLTGLLNRRGLEKVYSGPKVEQIIRKNCLSVVMIDIDHFKRINDVHGHLKGDEVLISISDSLRANIREAIAISRLGGEEICIFLSSCSEEKLELTCDYIRSYLIQMASQPEINLNVTASMGALLVDEHYGEMKLDVLVHYADCLMYQAKRAGRDKAVIARYSAVSARMSNEPAF
ncbi:sensor domain-containing diguanylate cyclase [Enterovibrio sp. ZSDZ35]|uniref:diguanylate cyclase n=1 Tax=Enterovibrio qingdaonensis TaxID=2899818 RepID=A0ABT5QKZ8_9GAMM|nr:sensor domain-containing diguanylate cyclase [Enterovibrio sp. ZSDZ35]MDD1781655.1 sensor domain-containing diguanylate cyclase [Enterovibrio sp. ZSDZ35]